MQMKSAIPFALALHSLHLPLFTLAQEYGLGRAKYALVDDYEPSNFFDGFIFRTTPDAELSHGYVHYESRDTAESLGLISSADDSVYIGVDHTTEFTFNASDIYGYGRPSVRLESKKTYTHGLFILDAEHMPVGCGTWPAFWTYGNQTTWPTDGEIDIMENWNTNSGNTMTLHTSGECLDAGSYETGVLLQNNCSISTNAGCGVRDTRTNSSGSGFNAIGGGVYAMEWTSYFIRIWFFPNTEVPSSIIDGKPDPDGFGPSAREFELPAANFMTYPNGSCNIDERFKTHNIVINTDFCGDLAGNNYGATSCPQYPGLDSVHSCVRFVAENPDVFTDAYWRIKSLKVYQMETLPPYIGPWPTTQEPPMYTSWYHPGLGWEGTGSRPGVPVAPAPTSPPPMTASPYAGPNSIDGHHFTAW